MNNTGGLRTGDYRAGEHASALMNSGEIGWLPPSGAGPAAHLGRLKCPRGCRATLAASESLQDSLVGASERQELQSVLAKPASFGCRDSVGITARDAIRLQRDAVAGDGVFDRGQRFKCSRPHSQGAVSRLS